jgi:hypothetical protein
MDELAQCIELPSSGVDNPAIPHLAHISTYSMASGSDLMQDFCPMKLVASSCIDENPTKANIEGLKLKQAQMNEKSIIPMQNQGQDDPPEAGPFHLHDYSQFLENVQILSPTELENTMKGILRPHPPETQSKILCEIAPPSPGLLVGPSNRRQKNEFGHQFDQYPIYYLDTMKGIYQDAEVSIGSGSLMRTIGDFLAFEITIQSVNFHSSEFATLVIPSASQHEVYHIEKLFTIMRNLQKWLTQIHSILWREVKGNLDCQIDHQKMMLWLFEEVFNPKNSIPVLGRTHLKNLCDSQFGPVQIWIINLLQEQDCFYKTSLGIAAIWFKNNFPDEWDVQFKMDDLFWIWAHVLLSEDILPIEASENVGFIQSKKNLNVEKYKNYSIYMSTNQSSSKPVYGVSKYDFKVDFPSGSYVAGFSEGDFKIGKFKLIFETRHFSLRNKPPKAITSSSMKILKELSKNSSLARNACEIIVKKPEFRIAITKSKDDKYFIRFLAHNLRNILEYQYAKPMVGGLLNGLEFYSSFIFSYLGLNEKELNDVSQAKFLGWFSTKVFGNKIHSIFPMIGRIENTSFYQNIIPSFDEVQIFIIETFFRNHHAKNHHAALLLLAYWFKYENPSFWEEHFKTETGFCDAINKNFIGKHKKP